MEEIIIYQTIWFVLWAVLWTGYFVLDGFDLGAGSLVYALGRDLKERQKVYAAIGPFWDGNEVWLVTAGGATFAAFPITYAIMFSSLYAGMLLLLFCLIIRGIAVEYRNKHNDPKWQKTWDLLFFIGSVSTALLLGVVFANIFQGVPIDAEGIFQGGFFTLLNFYGILGGFLFVAVFAMHGACWMAFRTKDEFSEKAAKLGKLTWIAAVSLLVIFWIVSYTSTDMWNNYLKTSILFTIPALTLVAGIAVMYFLNKAKYFFAWISSALTILFFSAWAFVGLFPYMFPSSIDPAYSLTIYNSSSSLLTLKIMTVVAAIFMPIVLAYTFWAYKTFASIKLNGEKFYY